MARATRGGNSAYPLSRNSDARRRRLIACGTPQADERAHGAGTVPQTESRFLPVQSTPGMATIRQMLAGTRPATWVFTGDSITHGGQHTGGSRCFVEHFSERVRWELRRLLDVVVNTGVSGGKSSGLLKTLDWRVLRFQPDVVPILIGMNDAAAGPEGREKFHANLTEIVRRVQDSGAIPVLQTPNTVYLAHAETRFDLAAYVEIIRTVAETAEVPLVDHWHHWQRIKPEQNDLRAWLSDGSIHPGAYGHREMAKLICHDFGIFDAASPTCSWDVP